MHPIFSLSEKIRENNWNCQIILGKKKSSTPKKVVLDDASSLSLPIVILYIIIELHLFCPSVFTK